MKVYLKRNSSELADIANNYQVRMPAIVLTIVCDAVTGIVPQKIIDELQDNFEICIGEITQTKLDFWMDYIGRSKEKNLILSYLRIEE